MVVVFSMATRPMGDALAVGNRALMTPRGLVKRRNGAETARSGRADWAILCDSSIAVEAALTVSVDDEARLRRGGHFQQRFFREPAEVFGVVHAIDRAAELGLTPHLVDPFDLAELLPRRGHQLLLLRLHDCSAERGDRSVPRIEIQFMQPGWHGWRAGGAGGSSTVCCAACQQP